MAKKPSKKDKPKTKPKKPTALGITMLAVEFLKDRLAALEARVAALEKAAAAPKSDERNKMYWPALPNWPAIPNWPTRPLPTWDDGRGVGKMVPAHTTETPGACSPATVTMTDTFTWHKPEEVVGPGRNTLK